MTNQRRTYRALPGWVQTIRFRLTATYSLVLFGVSAVAIAGIYLVLSATVEAAPLEPVRVQPVLAGSPLVEPVPGQPVDTPAKVWTVDGQWQVDEDASFEAADIAAVEAAVNHELLATLRSFAGVALAVLLAASLVIGWWLSGRALRPVRHITAAARDISATDLSRRIDLGGPRDELRTLAETLDGMLGRLHQAFTAQRQLIDDASHELRNPLAVVQVNLDAVLSHHDVPRADRAKAATVVARATGRMRHVVEDLLSAARRRSPAFVDEAIPLWEVANQVADEYELLARQREVRLTRRVRGDPVAAGDPSAIHRAAENLLANAVRWSAPDGEVEIGAGGADGWVWLAVRDQGPGVPVSDLDRIFDRFHTGTYPAPPGDPTPPSADPAPPGTDAMPAGTDPTPAGTDQTPAGAGLGLAIVRQIAESHDGTVTVLSDGGPGSTFVLWLPERLTLGISARSPHPPEGDPLPPVGTKTSRVTDDGLSTYRPASPSYRSP